MKPRRMYNGRSGKVNSYFSRIVACRLRKRDRILAAMHDGTLSTSFAPLSKKAREAFERQCRLIRLLAQSRFSKRCEESTSRLLLLTELPLPVTSGERRSGLADPVIQEGEMSYLIFGEGPTSASGLTKSWYVSSTGSQLGYVKWYAPWRKYCYFPAQDIILDEHCLADIAGFCRTETILHKEKS